MGASPRPRRKNQILQLKYVGEKDKKSRRPFCCSSFSKKRAVSANGRNKISQKSKEGGKMGLSPRGRPKEAYPNLLSTLVVEMFLRKKWLGFTPGDSGVLLFLFVLPLPARQGVTPLEGQGLLLLLPAPLGVLERVHPGLQAGQVRRTGRVQVNTTSLL